MLLLSQSEFAKRVGVSQPAISKLIKQGKLPFQGKKLIMPDAEKAYYLIKSGVGIAAPTMPEVFATGDAPCPSNTDFENQNVTPQDYLNVKVKKENILSEIHKTNLQKMQGDLISLDDVCKAVVSVCEIVRNELINLPTKIAPTLVDLSATEIQYALDDAINEILTNLYNMQDEYAEQTNTADIAAVISDIQA